ncbi:hypothetical protein ACPPVS_04535 [Cellulomonas sp. McL0617]|uniref:hypothetical protein n=1 Tax=Cellulomonas sp. McL0617 TaxID=3415675 RepID=UPI003CEFA530
MSTRESRRPLRAAVPLLAAGLAVLALSAYFLAIGEPDTAAGAVVGGLPFLVLAGVALWRSWRRPGSTGTASRTLAGQPDERDRAIVAGAFAWAGIAAVVAIGVATVAVTFGADPLAVLQLTMLVVYATLIGAFVVLSRRT